MVDYFIDLLLHVLYDCTVSLVHRFVYIDDQCPCCLDPVTKVLVLIFEAHSDTLVLDEGILVSLLVIFFLLVLALLIHLVLVALDSSVITVLIDVEPCLFIVVFRHLVVVVLVVVPGLSRAWIALGQYEYFIVGAQLDALLGVGDHIPDLFQAVFLLIRLASVIIAHVLL